MDSFALDLRAALRALRKRPAFTAVAILTLALGIGANTALFSVVHAVLLRPLPFHEPEQLIHVTNRVVGSDFELTPAADYLDWRDQSGHLAGITAWSDGDDHTLRHGEVSERLQGARVSASFFPVLGLRLAQGRGFLATEEKLQGGRVAVVSHRLWNRLFGAAVRLEGQMVRLSDEAFTIVGVLPDGFLFPRSPEVDVLLPLALDETTERGRRQMTLVQLIARLGPGVTAGQARAELETIQKRARAAARESLAAEAAAGPRPGAAEPPPGPPPGSGEGRMIIRMAPGPGSGPGSGPGPGGPPPGAGPRRGPGGGGPGGPPGFPETLLVIQPLREWLVGDIRPSLLMLLASVGCVLLIACANVANLLLARATSRRREIAVRAALGAGRGRIVRLLLTESTLLAVLGGACGLLLAHWTIQPLVALMPPDLADGLFRFTTIGIDAPVLLFTFLVSCSTGLLFGLVPAIAATRVDLQDPLKEEGRGGRSGALRGLLVAAEVAVAAVLLVVAGLLLRSFLRLNAVDPGFEADPVLTLQVGLDPERYPTPDRQAGFFQESVRRVAALPGVRSVSFASTVPLTGFSMLVRGIQAEGQPPIPIEEMPETAIVLAGPDYFQTLGIPLLRGRAFTAADTAGAPDVAIVSRAMARRYWGEADPVGRRLRGMRRDMLVIGVAEDVKHEGVITESSRLVMYFPFLQQPLPFGFLAVRAAGDPAELTAAVRDQLLALDPSIPISDVATLRERLRGSVADRRFQLTLLGLFALLALGLAGVGLYGVLAYMVGERTQEIGIRMALGAERGRVLTLVVRQGLRLAAAGLAAGLVLSLPAGRLLRSSLYGVTPADPVTYILIPAALLGVALLSSWLPARRATRVDPAVALRKER